MDRIVTFFLLLFIGIEKSSAIEIRTESGPVFGDEQLYGYKRVLRFKNIPFAKPPLNESRFQRPRDVTPWANSNDIVQNRISACTQFGQNNEVFGTEDCLLLDIYTTKVPNEAQTKLYLPVVVYFHGGRFVKGHKDEYVPSNLLKENDIVFVIPNYRLGILGFLSTGDDVMSGNLGLFDQRKALHWISRNIAFFGGDPSKVTIAGHGAGGASVGLHILSRNSHDFYSAAISASGTALDPWAVQNSSLFFNDAKVLASHLGCPTDSSNAILECYKKLPASKLVSAQKSYRNMYFGPVIDKDTSKEPFLTDHPLNLYKRKDFAKVPYLAGVTRDEASIEFYTEFADAEKQMHLEKILVYYMSPYLRNVSSTDVVVKAANYQYFRGINAGSFLEFAPHFTRLLSDFLYNSGLEQTLRYHSKVVADTWMYMFSYEGDKSLGDVFGPAQYKGKYGVSHMEDLIYLFDTTFLPIAIGDKSNKMKNMEEQLGQIWKTFITSRTTSPSRRWSRYNSTNGTYLEIGDAISIKMHYRQHEIDFWTILVPDLLQSQPTAVARIVERNNNTATWGVAGLAMIFAVLCVALTAVVIVTRKRILRNCSVPVCTTHETVPKSSKV